jgi:hypothetical protein
MSVPRSLADDLRRRSDEDIASLLQSRPDLLQPIPKSFADLAMRANTAASALQAMADATAGELAVLEAACALAGAGRFDITALGAGLGQAGSDSQLDTIVAALMQQALLWGSTADLRVPSAVREIVGRTPCGLEPRDRGHASGISRIAAEPQWLANELALAPVEVAEKIEQLAWQVRPLHPDRPLDQAVIEWLTERKLLATDDTGELVLSRTVALAVRNGLLIQEPPLHPPTFIDDNSGDQGDAAARDTGHVADQLLRAVDRLADLAARQPLTRQANGAVRSRDWQEALIATDLPEGDLALVLSLCWQLGWLDDDGSRRLLPTTAFHEAGTLPREQRWAALVVTWLSLPQTPSSDPVAVLSLRPDPQAVTQRRQVLRAAVAVAPQHTPEWLAWSRPRHPIAATEIAAILSEARTLGLMTVTGATPAARQLLATIDPAALAPMIESVLPELSPDLILQADLTATALGPLPRTVERRLAGLAETESSGAGAVFRFTPESVRRAIGDGESAQEVLEWLAGLSKTPIPQALEVLLTDADRQRAAISVVALTAVVRCDAKVADSLIQDPALADCGLQLLAPGVLGSQVPAAELARLIKQLGHEVLEDTGSGAPLATPARAAVGSSGSVPDPHRIVSSLRRVEQQHHPELHPPNDLQPLPAADLRALFNRASLSHGQLWLRFSDEDGAPQTHLVEPLAVTDGEVCAFDLTSSEIRVVPFARVTAATTHGG